MNVMISPISDCATGTIEAYVPTVEKPWNKQRAMHLLRRMGFGGNLDMVNSVLSESPSVVVDAIVEEAMNLPLLEPPVWADWGAEDYTDADDELVDHFLSWGFEWVKAMKAHGFREKFALFWHNHFVTQWQTYFCSKYLYQYHKLLQTHALGNFRTFTKEMGKTPAMLVFLNGNVNTQFNPNENYARELYELFTLGEGNNYTQTDITETARALTGWWVDNAACADPTFMPTWFDNGSKTIFGQTGNFDFDGVHDLLFEQRADEIALHICTKIYKHFVNENVSEDIVAALAITFIENDFELAPVFKQLFNSEHFFDEANIGVHVKSPLDFFITFIREGDFPINDEILTLMGYAASQLGQTLFEPVDVAGWQGHYSWITNSTLTTRWQMLTDVVGYLYETAPDSLRDFAKLLTNDSNDPAFITKTIVDHFTGRGLQTQADYQKATIVFKYEVPQNYFDDGIWNLDWEYSDAMVALLLFHIVKLPEHQLS